MMFPRQVFSRLSIIFLDVFFSGGWGAFAPSHEEPESVVFSLLLLLSSFSHDFLAELPITVAQWHPSIDQGDQEALPTAFSFVRPYILDAGASNRLSPSFIHDC